MYVYGWFNFQRVEFCVGPRQRASTGTMQNSDDVSEHSALTLSRPISIVLHIFFIVVKDYLVKSFQQQIFLFDELLRPRIVFAPKNKLRRVFPVANSFRIEFMVLGQITGVLLHQSLACVDHMDFSILLLPFFFSF